MGSLAEFKGLQKKVDREECLTLTPGWVDQTATKEEGRWKSNGHGIVARTRNGGGGRDAVFNNGVDPQLRIMDRMREMMAAARLDNVL